MKLHKKLEQFSASFERKTRDNGEAFIILGDNKKEWMANAVYAAHDVLNAMPSDSIYEMVEKIVDCLSDSEANDRDEMIEALQSIEPYIMTRDLLNWLGSNPYNVEYLETAVVEYGQTDGFSILSTAHYAALQEMGYAIIDSICEHFDLE